MEELSNIISLHWRDGVEILILAALLYYGFLYFRATRGARILTGLIVLFVALTLLARFLQLEVITSLLRSLSIFLAIALVVIFQPELRRALAELGSQSLFGLFAFGKNKGGLIEELTETVEQLSKKRYGALFAIQRDIDLKPHEDTGVNIDALFSPELASSIFHPKTALHDGGVTLNGGRISAAACVFPVSQREMRDRSLGLRHRAGIGISEETDAIAIIVSEETGHISLSSDGTLERNLQPQELRERLDDLLGGKKKGNEEELEDKDKS